MAESCSTCKFQDGDRCRRFPPQATDNPGDLWQQPKVRPDDRCGEWQWEKRSSALKGGKRA